MRVNITRMKFKRLMFNGIGPKKITSVDIVADDYYGTVFVDGVASESFGVSCPPLFIDIDLSKFGVMLHEHRYSLNGRVR